MLELQGKYSTAKVFTANIEQEAISQIINLLNQEFVTGSKIRIMPDVHAGAGCTIGTTMTITDKIVPNLVGVDVGCGMTVAILKDEVVDLEKLDKVIHEFVPAGFSVRAKAHSLLSKIDLSQLRCGHAVNLNRAELSLGTLGGGNHFIELGQDNNGTNYLVVHTGSRNLGKQVAEFYQREAAKSLDTKREQVQAIIADLKAQGRESEIQEKLKKLDMAKVDTALAYVEGALFDDYLHDMALTQKYADLNRKAIVDVIVTNAGLSVADSFTTIHNYVDIENMILRKGAVSAQAGERLIIPMNMRDGSLICVGKGNADWNQSAPHGAGRIMSRSAAKRAFTLEQFESSMSGIYSSTVNRSTLDEAPMAYKPINEIKENIVDTVDIVSVIKPLYNFKSAE